MKVVCVLIVEVVDPPVATATPLMLALIALVVRQVTNAVVADCMVAVICAVGAGVLRSIDASAEGGPYE